MQEKQIEAKLRDGVKKLGGLCLKWTSPGTRGVPDRIVIWPTGRVEFVELKTEKGKLSPLQKHILQELDSHCCNWSVLYGLEDVKGYLEHMKRSLRV